jgi:peptide deformylase
MVETMEAANGAGLAAVQIGVAQRVVIFGVEYNPRYPDADPCRSPCCESRDRAAR